MTTIDNCRPVVMAWSGPSISPRARSLSARWLIEPPYPRFTTYSTSALHSIRTRKAPPWQKGDLSRQRANSHAIGVDKEGERIVRWAPNTFSKQKFPMYHTWVPSRLQGADAVNPTTLMVTGLKRVGCALRTRVWVDINQKIHSSH